MRAEPAYPVFEDELVAGQGHVESVLALALAVQRDASLRAAIADGDPLAPTVLALSGTGPYVVVEHGRVASSAMVGAVPSGLSRVALLADVLADEPALRDSFHAAVRIAEPEARRTIAAMSTDAERFTRADFAKLERWAPLLAVHAYRHTVTIQASFDVDRARLVASSNAADLRTYWERVHLLGHLTILATSAEPVGWLADMARAITWRVWTPSFPLVRERILRLAVRGGWAAARFGTSVIAPYFERLAGGQPLHAFDATLGLVAIASAHDTERRAITDELLAVLAARERVAPSEVARDVYAALARSAQRALEAPADAARLVLARATPGASTARALAQAVDTDDDAADVDGHGHYAAILAMAGLANAPASVWFPDDELADAPRWRPARAQRTLGRTRTIDPHVRAVN